MRRCEPVRIVSVLLLFTALAWAQASAPAEPPQQGQSTEAAQSPDATAPVSETNAAGLAIDSQQSPNTAEPPAQTNSTAEPAAPLPAIEPQKRKKQEPSPGQQTDRAYFVVPNFAAVSAGATPPPLTVKGKFILATKDTFDYSGFVWTGILSAQTMAVGEYPEFGTGAAGYGRYYWHAFVDGISGSYFTEAIVPSLTREDPRYYTLGSGGFLKRVGYALSRVVVTKTDSGGSSFNFSEVGGNAAVAGAASLYYPPEERGVTKFMENWGTQLESAALNNVAKEFWPDIRRMVLRHKQ